MSPHVSDEYETQAAGALQPPGWVFSRKAVRERIEQAQRNAKARGVPTVEWAVVHTEQRRDGGWDYRLNVGSAREAARVTVHGSVISCVLCRNITCKHVAFIRRTVVKRKGIRIE